ncbi:MAG: Fur family ferric uptake transcriptional regulator [Myxococcota bacterium]|jgi:Fur family ferric uptake transcriptional regulator
MVTPSHPTPIPLDLLRSDIRSAGLRATGARIAVLRVMREAGQPMSHAEVAETLDGESWDKATVYRNLVDLAKAGLLRRAVLGDPVWRFEEMGDSTSDGHAHAHFVCVTCGTIECLPEDAVTVEANVLRTGTAIDVQLRGDCVDCAAP